MAEKLRVCELFAGYGSQRMALERLKEKYEDFNFEVVAISEIDKYALAAYEAVHGDCPNYGNICDIDFAKMPDFDLMTYSFPCTDISSAGKQKGLTEGSGTRSSLLWECQRAITAKRPRYLLMENVKALTQKKFMPEFRRWILWLEEQGYNNFWQVLNSKDYGVPQNRERVFMVSILDPQADYQFPKPFPLEKRLKDVLEEEVDESYYLKDEQVKRIIEACDTKIAEGLGV